MSHEFYSKSVFKGMDNNDYISIEEFYEALRRIMPSIIFGFETVEIFFSVYDKNMNNRIEFTEFYELFKKIYELYKEFEKNDVKKVTKINSQELNKIFLERGFEFSQGFFDYILFENLTNSGQKLMTFDKFVRFNSRFEVLYKKYIDKGLNDLIPLENYIKNNYFY